MSSVLNFFTKGGKDACEKEYKLGKTLGKGSFAEVKLATHKKEETQWAVKIIKRESLEKGDSDALDTEVKILRMVDHPHIVHLKQVFDCGPNFYMVMEVCEGGELFDRIVEKEQYSEAEAVVCVKAIVEALAYCHEKQIVHRDLKPENLLYKDGNMDRLKLADFGLAHMLEPAQALHTACGTPGYVAPEILTGTGYGAPVDMWSVGVIMYILLCGFPPFYVEGPTEALFQVIKKGEYEFTEPFWDDISTKAKTLIQHLLELDTEKRYTAKQVLEDPWITGEASTVPIKDFKQNMLRYNARRKFKAGIMALQAVRMIEKLTGKTKEL